MNEALASSESRSRSKSHHLPAVCMRPFATLSCSVCLEPLWQCEDAGEKIGSQQVRPVPKLMSFYWVWFTGREAEGKSRSKRQYTLKEMGTWTCSPPLHLSSMLSIPISLILPQLITPHFYRTPWPLPIPLEIFLHFFFAHARLLWWPASILVPH